MIRFDYDYDKKRHNVKVPFSLAGERDMTTVALIKEDNKITFHRELRIGLVQQILMHWTEYSHQLEMKDKIEQEEFNHLMKGDR